MEKIGQIAWSTEFAVGHKELDSEHLRLVETVNAIYDAAGTASGRKKVDKRLDELSKLAADHFKHENSLLLQISRSPIPSNVERLDFVAAVADAVLDRHIGEHARGLRALDLIIRDMRIAIEKNALNHDLKDWLLEHMTVHDARLKPIFSALKRDQTQNNRL